MARPEIDEADVEAVVAVLRSGRLALGPKAEAFEEALARLVGVRHGVAVSSGTAGLHLAVRALGLAPGDEVLVPSFTFVASVTPLLFEDLTPVFVDVDPQTGNLDPEDLDRKVTSKSRAIMVVDAFGHPAPWPEIDEIAERRGLAVIDDCCEALGAEYRGRKLGSFGRAGVFAFYPNKQITTGEGGLVTTDDDALAALVRSLRNQGRDGMGSWLEHPRLGFNYRMDEMSAALGLSQLGRLESFLRRRQAAADLYAKRLAGIPWLELPRPRPEVRMSWFVYVVKLAPGLDRGLDGGLERDRVMIRLAEAGVPSRAYFRPVHLQPFLRGRPGCEPGTLPVTEDLARRTLALPFWPGITAAEVDRVASALEEAAER